MSNSPKSINSHPQLGPKAKPLTLKEVLQLRDGLEIARHPSPAFPQTIALLSILQNINPLNSLN